MARVSRMNDESEAERVPRYKSLRVMILKQSTVFQLTCILEKV